MRQWQPKCRNSFREADITRSVRDLLRILGIFHYKHWQGPMSQDGIADIIGCYHGRFVAIEIKRPGRRPTPAQQRFLDNVRDAGGIAFVATCPEDVARGFAEHGVHLNILF